ncbi:hypothetical protein P171DRAFT_478002 [Karstenula rhodostoma CBS 690.94]|uniref:Rhodopsin domain-containing protein n=1 Tax=Karstenula rhodostoma CBS 690.94 TaxID=1392251 RepID=A0A9P4P763_9PLEO|nr:hypothetical protein P171DRAFT_478002 [Karstenula rhodostoma CBS 690.94]
MSGTPQTTSTPPDAPIPSPSTTTLVSVIIVFLDLATITLGLRVYCARISARDKWFTVDLMLIIAALIVTYGCILTTIMGAATLGLDYTNNKMDPVQGAQLLFEIQFFSTNPISSAWHPERQLVDLNHDYPTALLAIFDIGIVLDFPVLCPSLRPIWQLQLLLANKIEVSLILWLGNFCVGASSVRFYYSYRQFNVVFVTTAQEKGTIAVQSSLWSRIERAAPSLLHSCPPMAGYSRTAAWAL